MNVEERSGTYVANGVIQDVVFGEGMQHFNNRFEPFDQFGRIALPEFVKRLCLFFEYINDGISAVTAIDLGGEWVIAKIFAGLFSVLHQGSIENRLKVGRGCSRIRGHG